MLGTIACPMGAGRGSLMFIYRHLIRVPHGKAAVSPPVKARLAATTGLQIRKEPQSLKPGPGRGANHDKHPGCNMNSGRFELVARALWGADGYHSNSMTPPGSNGVAKAS